MKSLTRRGLFGLTGVALLAPVAALFATDGVAKTPPRRAPDSRRGTYYEATGLEIVNEAPNDVDVVSGARYHDGEKWVQKLVLQKLNPQEERECYACAMHDTNRLILQRIADRRPLTAADLDYLR